MGLKDQPKLKDRPFSNIMKVAMSELKKKTKKKDGLRGKKKRRLVREDCRKFAGKKVNNTKVGGKMLSKSS